MEDYLALHSTPSSSSLSDYDVLSRVSDDDLLGSTSEYVPVSLADAGSVATSHRDSWGSSDASLSVLSSFASEGPGGVGSNDEQEEDDDDDDEDDNDNDNNNSVNQYSSQSQRKKSLDKDKNVGLYRSTRSSSSSALIDWQHGAALHPGSAPGSDPHPDHSAAPNLIDSNSNMLDRSFDLGKGFNLGLSPDSSAKSGSTLPNLVPLKDVPRHLRWLVALKQSYMKESLEALPLLNNSGSVKLRHFAKELWWPLGVYEHNSVLNLSSMDTHNHQLPRSLTLLNVGPYKGLQTSAREQLFLQLARTLEASLSNVEVDQVRSLPHVQVPYIDVLSDIYRTRLMTPNTWIEHKHNEPLQTALQKHETNKEQKQEQQKQHLFIAVMFVDDTTAPDVNPELLARFFHDQKVHLLTVFIGHTSRLRHIHYNLPIDLSLPYKIPWLTADQDAFKWPKKVFPLNDRDLFDLLSKKDAVAGLLCSTCPRAVPYEDIAIVPSHAAKSFVVNHRMPRIVTTFLELLVPSGVLYEAYWKNNHRFSSKNMPSFVWKILATFLSATLVLTYMYSAMFSGLPMQMYATSTVTGLLQQPSALARPSTQVASVPGFTEMLQSAVDDCSSAATPVKKKSMELELSVDSVPLETLTIKMSKHVRHPEFSNEVITVITETSLIPTQDLGSKEISVMPAPQSKHLSVIEQHPRKDLVEFVRSKTEERCSSFLWRMRRGAATLCKQNSIMNALYTGALSLDIKLKNVPTVAKRKYLELYSGPMGDFYEDVADATGELAGGLAGYTKSTLLKAYKIGQVGTNYATKSLKKAYTEVYTPEVQQRVAAIGATVTEYSGDLAAKAKEYTHRLAEQSEPAVNKLSGVWDASSHKIDPGKDKIWSTVKHYVESGINSSLVVGSIVSENSMKLGMVTKDVLARTTETCYRDAKSHATVLWSKSRVQTAESYEILQQTLASASIKAAELASVGSEVALEKLNEGRRLSKDYYDSLKSHSKAAAKHYGPLMKDYSSQMYKKVSGTSKSIGSQVQNWWKVNKGPMSSKAKGYYKGAHNWWQANKEFMSSVTQGYYRGAQNWWKANKGSMSSATQDYYKGAQNWWKMNKGPMGSMTKGYYEEIKGWFTDDKEVCVRKLWGQKCRHRKWSWLTLSYTN